MGFQSGTVVNLNDLLDEFATFLAANGWTIVGNWREPMTMTVSPTGGGMTGDEPVYHWRWARRVHASKGTLHISMQDVFTTKDIIYGTNTGIPGGQLNAGPQISAAISSSINAQPSTPAQPYHGPPSFFPDYPQPGTPTSVNAIVRTVTMPLPHIVDQPAGSWVASTGGGEAPIDLPAAFGNPGGSAVPCPYWFMCDASGDNVIMCVVRTGDLSYIPIVSYLYFGKVEKQGTWNGGEYIGACHGNNGAWVNTDTFKANRWGPPGSMMDGTSVHTLLHIEIDSFVGANRYAGLQLSEDNNIWTGRHFSSTTLLSPKPGDPAGGIFGTQDNGVHYGTARFHKSSLMNGAPMLPTYWVAKRDNDLYSILGLLPNIYQAETTGFAPGEEYTAKDGTIYVVFDGFAVKKVP